MSLFDIFKRKVTPEEWRQVVQDSVHNIVHAALEQGDGGGISGSFLHGDQLWEFAVVQKNPDEKSEDKKDGDA